jgi:hypothetical protein
LRGFGVFEDILSNSKKVVQSSLIAYVNLCQDSAGFPVKVGFLLSKKKLKKLTIGTGFAGY